MSKPVGSRVCSKLETVNRLVAQLTSRRQKPRSDGRFQLESKEDMRRRGLPSSDRADAVVMALATTRSHVNNYARVSCGNARWQVDFRSADIDDQHFGRRAVLL